MTNEDEHTPTSLFKVFINIVKVLLSGGQPFLLTLISLQVSAQLKVDLNEVEIKSKPFVEKKFGLKKRLTGIHFVDGLLNQKKNFEIAQSIQLPPVNSRISSVNIYVGSSRKDSVRFKLNFYEDKTGLPAARILKESILFVSLVREGWLQLDLKSYAIYLKNKCYLSLEYLPDKKVTEPLALEVKLGGATKTYVRQDQGDWLQAPHHYLVYLTALVPEKWKEESEFERPATHHLFSKQVGDSFSIFISLPANYSKNRHYPVVYLLDANAYFDQLEIEKENPLSLHNGEFITAGIGYQNAYLMDSLRLRDYTWPAPLEADSCLYCGKGAIFYDFLQHDLIPFIDSTYNTLRSKRTLAGHSMAGHFTLYAFLRGLQEPSAVFDNYVAVSPHLNYAGAYLLRELETQTNKTHQNKSRLYIAYGEKELEDPSDLVYSRRLNLLFNQSVKPDYAFEIIPGAGHMEAAIPGLERGIGHQKRR